MGEKSQQKKKYIIEKARQVFVEKGYRNVTMKDIMDERRKELFAEGHIAFDYWRNGMSVNTAMGEIPPDDYRTVLPLPKEEIDIAKGRLLQNPGYGK